MDTSSRINLLHKQEEKNYSSDSSLKFKRSYIGYVTHLPSKFYRKSKKTLQKYVNNSPHFFVRERKNFLQALSLINNISLFILKKLESINLKNVIEGLSYIGGVIKIIGLLDLTDLAEQIIHYPKQVRAAKKTKEIAKVFFMGLGLLSKIIKTPSNIIDTFKPFVMIGDISKWAPTLGIVSLVLGTAFLGLKVWDIFDTYQFTEKIKEKCCLELLHNLEEDLKTEFHGDRALVDKIDLALAFGKDKKYLKSLHKKEQAFQQELLKKTPNPTELLKLLDEIEVFGNQLDPTVEQIKGIISLYELNQCLSNPKFKKSVLELTSKLLEATGKEIKMLKEGEEVDLKELKRAIKSAAAQHSPELLAKVNQSAKMAYLTVLAETKSRKLQKFYLVDGTLLQGAAKKTSLTVKTLLEKNENQLADEKLSIAYKELKGRVSFKSFSSRISALLNTIGIAAGSISLAIATGTLATPLAPLGMALGSLASAIGILLALTSAAKAVRFEENIGIRELKLQQHLINELNRIDSEHPFYTNLTPIQMHLFEILKMQANDGDFSNYIYYQFTLPQLDKQSTSEDHLRKITAKEMNALIKSLNQWVVQKRKVEDRILIQHWKDQLKKIDPNYLPQISHINLLESLKNVKPKKFHQLGILKQIPIENEWSRDQENAVKQLNSILETMHHASEKRYQESINNITQNIEMIKMRFSIKPKTKTRKNIKTLNRLESKLQKHQKILTAIQNKQENN